MLFFESSVYDLCGPLYGSEFHIAFNEVAVVIEDKEVLIKEREVICWFVWEACSETC